MPSDPALRTANLTPPPGVPGPLTPLCHPPGPSPEPPSPPPRCGLHAAALLLASAGMSGAALLRSRIDAGIRSHIAAGRSTAASLPASGAALLRS
jgi:hypothetical protein